MSNKRGQQGFSRQPAPASTMFCKMIVAIIGVALMAVTTTTGTDSAPYLDHVLKQYEGKVIKVGQRRSPVDIKATLISKPEGYEKPNNWTTDSALRLMYILKENKASTELKQTLSNLIDSSVAANSSEIKLRGTEEQSVVNIDNHMRANLPSAMVDLKTLIGLLLPKAISSWLSSFGSSKSPSVKGRGKTSNRGYGYNKGSGDRGRGEGGGGGSGSGSGAGGEWGGSGSGAGGDWGGGGWGGGGSVGGGWNDGGGWPGKPGKPGGGKWSVWEAPVINWAGWTGGKGRPAHPGRPGRPGRPEGSHSHSGPGSFSYSYNS